MADTDDRAKREEEGESGARPAEDPRKPYEAPQILKRRSVNRATLFTTMGVSAMSLTSMG